MNLTFPPHIESFRREVRAWFESAFPKDIVAKNRAGEALTTAECKVVGIAARASGQDTIANGFNKGSADATAAAKAVVDFSNSPLTIADEVVVGRPRQRQAQPAPLVPYTPAQ